MSSYTDMAKQLETFKMDKFKLTEANMKLKKENSRLKKDFDQAKEEKEIAEIEYVSLF